MATESKSIIELKELRIGNYLLFKGEIIHVTTLTLDVDDESEDTIGFCKLGQIHNEVSDWNRSLFTDIERIPLTNNWTSENGLSIGRLGLKTGIGYGFAGNFSLYLEDNGTSCEVYIEQYSEGRELLPDIKYVHQLQNLFFSLIGRELKVIQ
jgi:hypothetical protein